MDPLFELCQVDFNPKFRFFLFDFLFLLNFLWLRISDLVVRDGLSFQLLIYQRFTSTFWFKNEWLFLLFNNPSWSLRCNTSARFRPQTNKFTIFCTIISLLQSIIGFRRFAKMGSLIINRSKGVITKRYSIFEQFLANLLLSLRETKLIFKVHNFWLQRFQLIFHSIRRCGLWLFGSLQRKILGL